MVDEVVEALEPFLDEARGIWEEKESVIMKKEDDDPNVREMLKRRRSRFSTEKKKGWGVSWFCTFLLGGGSTELSEDQRRRTVVQFKRSFANGNFNPWLGYVRNVYLNCY